MRVIQVRETVCHQSYHFAAHRNIGREQCLNNRLFQKNSLRKGENLKNRKKNKHCRKASFNLQAGVTWVCSHKSCSIYFWSMVYFQASSWLSFMVQQIFMCWGLLVFWMSNLDWRLLIGWNHCSIKRFWFVRCNLSCSTSSLASKAK